MDENTRKLMKIPKALNQGHDIDRYYAVRKEGGRELASIVDCLDAGIQKLEEYIHTYIPLHEDSTEYPKGLKKLENIPCGKLFGQP